MCSFRLLRTKRRVGGVSSSFSIPRALSIWRTAVTWSRRELSSFNSGRDNRCAYRPGETHIHVFFQNCHYKGRFMTIRMMQGSSLGCGTELLLSISGTIIVILYISQGEVTWNCGKAAGVNWHTVHTNFWSAQTDQSETSEYQKLCSCWCQKSTWRPKGTNVHACRYLHIYMFFHTSQPAKQTIDTQAHLAIIYLYIL